MIFSTSVLRVLHVLTFLCSSLFTGLVSQLRCVPPVCMSPGPLFPRRMVPLSLCSRSLCFLVLMTPPTPSPQRPVSELRSPIVSWSSFCIFPGQPLFPSFPISPVSICPSSSVPQLLRFLFLLFVSFVYISLPLPPISVFLSLSVPSSLFYMFPSSIYFLVPLSPCLCLSHFFCSPLPLLRRP